MRSDTAHKVHRRFEFLVNVRQIRYRKRVFPLANLYGESGSMEGFDKPIFKSAVRGQPALRFSFISAEQGELLGDCFAFFWSMLPILIKQLFPLGMKGEDTVGAVILTGPDDGPRFRFAVGIRPAVLSWPRGKDSLLSFHLSALRKSRVKIVV